MTDAESARSLVTDCCLGDCGLGDGCLEAEAEAEAEAGAEAGLADPARDLAETGVPTGVPEASTAMVAATTA